MERIRQKHAKVRMLVDQVHLDCVSKKAKPCFLSMCLSIKSDMYRDALFHICEKHNFIRPVAIEILDEYENDLMNWRSVSVAADTEPHSSWNINTREKMRLLAGMPYDGDNLVMMCVADMIRTPIHIEAMFEICKKYGPPARTLVSFVLQFYSKEVIKTASSPEFRTV
jgi:hypothetical protein